jgi:hypothetical protein
MNRNRKMFAASVLFGLMVAGSALAADSPGAAPAADQEHGRTKTQVSGIVDGYNLDPRGSVNGIMLKDGDHLSQLNLPPDQGAAIAAAAPVGQKIDATGLTERANGDHAIYRLVSLTGADGKEITIMGPEDGTVAHVEATVKSLNYTPRGDVDGAILDSGDFLQLGPGAAKDVGLAIGQKIVADGKERPMVAGHNIIAATTVNGTSIHRRPMGRRGPGGPGGGGPDGDFGMGGPGGPGGPGGDGPMDMPPPPPGDGK